jgi:Ca-activated chloride channel family protein
VLSDRVPLFGGDSWLAMVSSARALSGGLAEAFADESRLAMAYAGLSTLPNAAVDLLINALGPRNIASRYAGVLLNYGAALDVVNGAMNPPGGSDAGNVWEKFAGFPPRNAGGFARALLDRDRGNGAAFYAAVKAASPERQRYLVTSQNLSRAYAWFAEIGPDRAAAIVKELPLEPSGALYVPGGAEAWPGTPLGSRELPGAVIAERLIAIAKVEQARKAMFDDASVKQLVRHYDDWRAIFPYFEKIPALGRAEFDALHAFTMTVRQLPAEHQSTALGAWYSLVELIASRAVANPEHSREAADAFRRACDPLPTTATIAAVLRALFGRGGRVDETAIASALRLDESHESSFSLVLTLQHVPRLDAAFGSNDVGRVIQSLTGVIYALSFPSSGLLISEDENLVRKHRFVQTAGPLFAPAKLTSDPSGSHISGGLLNLRALAERLAAGGGSESVQSGSDVMPGRGSGAAADSIALERLTPADVFRADARLVMVSATVMDARDRYVDDLKANDFQILEDGRARPAVAFESLSSGVSCALLLDTTGSMYAALPALKSAAMRFIGDLRPVDSVAVYSFSESVSLLEPFTSDKGAAKRAVMGTRAAGQTALYDALTRVSRDLASRPGKKVIVVFTDGEDNLSTLASGLAVRRMKTIGTPVYTIAQGQALLYQGLLKQLSELSTVTGGLPFRVERASDISAVFERISADLAHGYLLSFQPSATGGSRDWHRIEVVSRRDKRYKVRAREGYFSE